MRPFTAVGNGTVLRLREPEARLLADLLQQLPDVLAAGRGDTAVARLLPDAYPGDEEASAEFRTFTEQGLVDGKLAQAALARATLDTPDGERPLSRDEEQAWLRSLADLRLVLADRLGIERDGDEGGTGPLRSVYEWLAYLQDCLIAVLEERL